MATEWEEQLTHMLLDIDRTLTPEQRSRAVKRAQKFVEDFRALSGART
jgi:predicted HAD superfamily phosphohydrolase YqeG